MPDVTFKQEDDYKIIYAYRSMTELVVALGLLGFMVVVYVRFSDWPKWLRAALTAMVR